MRFGRHVQTDPRLAAMRKREFHFLTVLVRGGSRHGELWHMVAGARALLDRYAFGRVVFLLCTFAGIAAGCAMRAAASRRASERTPLTPAAAVAVPAPRSLVRFRSRPVATSAERLGPKRGRASATAGRRWTVS